MMISTGLPELSSEKDVNYLRETLVRSATLKEEKVFLKDLSRDPFEKFGALR
jgi:hypothetical protein